MAGYKWCARYPGKQGISGSAHISVEVVLERRHGESGFMGIDLGRECWSLPLQATARRSSTRAQR